MDYPKAVIEMENGKKIIAELYTDIAPITANNFIKLVKEGFYNGLTFHRLVPGFTIQGGCPSGDGRGDPGYKIEGEFIKNGYNNPILHTRGTLSMARGPHYNSAGSQFFILVKDAPHLDGEYAAFGKVIEGMDVVDEIVHAKKKLLAIHKPKVKQIMKSVIIVEEE